MARWTLKSRLSIDFKPLPVAETRGVEAFAEVVDSYRELISTMLSPFDVELAQASKGVEAVTEADRNGFDLILMDLQMPMMDGHAAARAMRTRSKLNRRTPILAVSANVLPDQVAACKRAGMNGHIAKPIDLHDLVDRFDRWTPPLQEIH